MQTTTPRLPIAAWTGIACLTLILASCTTRDTYSEEPPVGTLKVGEVILVDDGSCPQGQVLEVTAGNRALLLDRKRRCVEK